MTRAVVTTAVLAFASSVASADTISVCLDGSCDYTDIQEAINAASDGDVIEIAAGTYYPAATIDTLGKSLTIRGESSPDKQPITILDGQNAIRVLWCLSGEGSETIIENLVVRNGLANGKFPFTRGGGCYLSASGPVFRNCQFLENSAVVGGAVFCDPGCMPTFIDCVFAGNSGESSAGALFLEGPGSVEMIRCQFQENWSDIWGGGLAAGGGQSGESTNVCLRDCVFDTNDSIFGGGALLTNCHLECTGCSFVSNNARKSSWWISPQGGGLWLLDTAGTIADCHFVHNEAKDGGAVYLTESTFDFINCVFNENFAGASGAAMDIGRCDGSFENCLFMNNVGNSGGAAIVRNNSAPTFTNCTFRENSALTSGGGAIECNDQSTPLFDGCDFQSNTASTYGGALWVFSSRPVISNSTFDMNVCKESGDDISFLGSSTPGTADIGSCTFEACCSIDPPMGYLDEGDNLFAGQVHVACDECRADVDCDDEVDAADLGLILSAWNTTEAQYDIDGDGVVGGGDLGMLLGAWGPCP